MFNHCGRRFAPWQDVLKNGQDSPYADWFMVHQWPLPDKHEDTRDGRFYSFAFADWMPKINTNNDEVIDYFFLISMASALTWEMRCPTVS